MNVHALVYQDIIQIDDSTLKLVNVTKDSDKVISQLLEVLSHTSNTPLALSLLRLLLKLFESPQKHKINLTELLKPLSDDVENPLAYKGLLWYRLAEQFAAVECEVKFEERTEDQGMIDTGSPAQIPDESPLIDRQTRMTHVTERRQNQQKTIEDCKLAVTNPSKPENTPLNPILMTNTLIQAEILWIVFSLNESLGE